MLYKFSENETMPGPTWSPRIYRSMPILTSAPIEECAAQCFFDYGECDRFGTDGSICFLGSGDGIYNVVASTDEMEMFIWPCKFIFGLWCFIPVC